MPRIALVCGGRDFSDYSILEKTLDLHVHNDMIVLHGGSKGADLLAENWCIKRGVHFLRCPALWGEYGNSAGPIRNSLMASLKPAICIAFPGGNGTRDMVTKCNLTGIEVVEIS